MEVENYAYDETDASKDFDEQVAEIVRLAPAPILKTDHFDKITFIEGTAAIGKGAALGSINYENDTVLFNNFGEIVKHYSWAKNRLSDYTAANAIANIEMGRLQQRGDRCRLVHRSPLAGIVYSVVTPAATKRSVKKITNNMLLKITTLSVGVFNALGLKKKIKIFINTDVDKVVKNMEERNNGLDVVNHKFVEMQNDAFTHIAKLFGFELFDVKDYSTNDLERIFGQWV